MIFDKFLITKSYANIHDFDEFLSIFELQTLRKKKLSVCILIIINHNKNNLKETLY